MGYHTTARWHIAWDSLTVRASPAPSRSSAKTCSGTENSNAYTTDVRSVGADSREQYVVKPIYMDVKRDIKPLIHLNNVALVPVRG